MFLFCGGHSLLFELKKFTEPFPPQDPDLVFLFLFHLVPGFWKSLGIPIRFSSPGHQDSCVGILFLLSKTTFKQLPGNLSRLQTGWAPLSSAVSWCSDVAAGNTRECVSAAGLLSAMSVSLSFHAVPLLSSPLVQELPTASEAHCCVCTPKHKPQPKATGFSFSLLEFLSSLFDLCNCAEL